MKPQTAIKDELDKIKFTCMVCRGKFSVTQGTWPQYLPNGDPMMDADHNNRSPEEFVCYDCNP